ncbi:MAG: hypothetical protein S4CHLAM2_00220 [Chlamydiales bacterium]|nr:hypothetical protein [Chlamydiales bacterium]
MELTGIKTSLFKLEGAKKVAIAASTVGVAALAVAAFVAIQAACLHTSPLPSLCFRACLLTTEGSFSLLGLAFIYTCLKPKKVSLPPPKPTEQPYNPSDWRSA